MADQAQTPMDLMKALSPAVAKAYLDHRAMIMDNPELSTLPVKTKLLIGIGVATALQSSMCTLMWVKLARSAGATDAELAETIAVSRLMKAATVNDTASDAIAWLLDQSKT